MNVEELLKNAPVFTKSDMSEEFYERFSRLREALLTRGEDSPKLLNPKNVTGIWYLPNLMFDRNNPQIILRAFVEREEVMFLDNEIFDFIYQDCFYEYDEVVASTQDDFIVRELVRGNVLTVYNGENV